MGNAIEQLKDYGMYIRHSDAQDREPIDFEIRDIETDELYATVWGSEPWKDVQIDCEHPSGHVEYEDDETVGECPICGATCDWHREGYADGFGEVYEERVPHDWHKPEENSAPYDIGGIVKKDLKEMQEVF